MDCQICCEKFNKSTRKAIQCPSHDCNESVCMSCFRRYLLEGGDIEPKCMVCSKKMSYTFVREKVPVTWANKEYLNMRTKHLLSREKSLLPDSQQDALDELDRRERVKKIEEIQVSIHEYERIITKLRRQQRELYNVPLRKEQVVTRRRCPEEECQGFLKSDWECGLCKLKCCSQCGVKKEENHTCDEETKASFQVIKTDTRPCPKCAIPIHKWEGCNQMYCTQCSCMFDYRTGRLETGLFHNPHYFEAIENGTIQGRDNNQAGGCRVINQYNFLYSLRKWKKCEPKMRFEVISNMLRLVNHIDDYTLRNHYTNENNDAECRKMRRDFLLKELDEKDWFRVLKIIEKSRERNTEIRQVLELFKDVGRDILLNIQEVMMAIYNQSYWEERPRDIIVNEQVIEDPTEYVFKQVNEFLKFKDFCNDKFIKIEHLFKNKAPEISPDLNVSKCLRI